MWARASLLFAFGPLVPAAALAAGHLLRAGVDPAHPSLAVPSGTVRSQAKAVEAVREGRAASHVQRIGETPALVQITAAGHAVLEHGGEAQKGKKAAAKEEVEQAKAAAAEKEGTTKKAVVNKKVLEERRFWRGPPSGSGKAFHIGQKVRQRDKEDEQWERGNVTSVSPLKVMPEGYDEASIWTFVEAVEATEEVTKAEPSLSKACSSPTSSPVWRGGEVWNAKACDEGDPCSKTCGDRIDSKVFGKESEEMSREIVARTYPACKACSPPTTTTTTTRTTSTTSTTSTTTTTTTTTTSTSTTATKAFCTGQKVWCGDADGDAELKEGVVTSVSPLKVTPAGWETAHSWKFVHNRGEFQEGERVKIRDHEGEDWKYGEISSVSGLAPYQRLTATPDGWPSAHSWTCVQPLSFWESIAHGKP